MSRRSRTREADRVAATPKRLCITSEAHHPHPWRDHSTVPPVRYACMGRRTNEPTLVACRVNETDRTADVVWEYGSLHALPPHISNLRRDIVDFNGFLPDGYELAFIPGGITYWPVGNGHTYRCSANIQIKSQLDQLHQYADPTPKGQPMSDTQNPHAAPIADADRPPTDPALRRAWERQRTTTRETSDAETPQTATRQPRLLGQTVLFRSRTGAWTAPAIVTATLDSLHRPNVDAGHVPPLTDGFNVHLTVLTPGIQGHVSDTTAAEHPELVADDRPNKPAGGSFQEWDVPEWVPDDPETWDEPFEYADQPAGTWTWPR